MTKNITYGSVLLEKHAIQIDFFPIGAHKTSVHCNRISFISIEKISFDNVTSDCDFCEIDNFTCLHYRLIKISIIKTGVFPRKPKIIFKFLLTPIINQTTLLILSLKQIKNKYFSANYSKPTLWAVDDLIIIEIIMRFWKLYVVLKWIYVNIHLSTQAKLLQTTVFHFN